MSTKPQKRSPRKKKRHLVTDKTQKDVKQVPSTFEEINADLKKAGWGKDKFTQDIEGAFCNIGVSFIELSPHFKLLQKAHEIFVDAFAQMSTNASESVIPHWLFGGAFGCFLGAVRLSSSGQLSETCILLRALIENSIYAFYIFESPERAEIWMNRHKNEDSRKKCKRTFTVGNIWQELKKNSPLIEKEARRYYDFTIDWGAHPNERSLIPNIVPKQDGSGFSFCSVVPPDFIRTAIICTIRTSLLTFRIFNLVFPEVFGQPNIDMKIKNLDKQSKPLIASLVVLMKKKST